MTKLTVRENADYEKFLKRLKKNELMRLGLPLKNAAEMNNFECKLKDHDFFTKMVCATHLNFICIDINILIPHTNVFQFDLFKTIGEMEGKSSGDTVLLAIFGYLIEPQFLATISWTGKSDSKQKKKIKFESFSEMIELISKVCVAADRKYSEVQCKKDMVYKVFKYAYRIKSDKESDGTPQNKSNSTPIIQTSAGNSQTGELNAADSEINLQNSNNRTNQQQLTTLEQKNTHSSDFHRLQAPQSSQQPFRHSAPHQPASQAFPVPFHSNYYQQSTPHES